MALYIGLAGPMGSGKGKIAKILKKRGFRYISLSDVVRNHATKRKLEHTRKNLQDVGNDLRNVYGAGVLGKIVRETIKHASGQDWVVDGIRNPAEVKELKELTDFHLVGVSAGKEILVERMLDRAREGEEEKTKEEILESIERGLGKGEPKDGQQVAKCLKTADVLIKNEGTLKELEDKFDTFYSSLSKNE
ncbi:MAG TPA: hypothetical protein ENI70_01205 [Candidatus Peregrinibacteria bacterium]|nr:hypothetical protein [Candidatus Peregrinibacteria bacterium]